MSQSIGEKEIPHLPYIDGLRGMAIFMVLVNHVFLFGNQGGKAQLGLYEWLTAGNRGVALFFMVSAFTLYGSSLERFPRERSAIGNFYVRRMFRILPLWWGAILVCALTFHLGASFIVPRALMYFGFLRFPNREFQLGEWSIFVEESFYLFFPLMFSRIRTLGNAIRLVLLMLLLRSLWILFAED